MQNYTKTRKFRTFSVIFFRCAKIKQRKEKLEPCFEKLFLAFDFFFRRFIF